MTLTELVVTVTIIGILGAVVATGVGGSTSAANESSRAQFFSAVQGAVDTFGQGHLPPDGDATKATYPFVHTSGAGTTIFTSSHKPSETETADQFNSWDWYGANGKILSPQPGATTTSATPPTGSAAAFTTNGDTFVYVDLYSGGANCIEQGQPYGSTSDTSLKTDIRCLGFLKVPGGATKAFGEPGTDKDGKVIRCLFVSNSTIGTVTDKNSGNRISVFGTVTGTGDAAKVTAITGGSGASAAAAEAAAKSAVGTAKGHVLACRDQDPGGTKTGT